MMKQKCQTIPLLFLLLLSTPDQLVVVGCNKCTGADASMGILWLLVFPTNILNRRNVQIVRISKQNWIFSCLKSKCCLAELSNLIFMTSKYVVDTSDIENSSEVSLSNCRIQFVFIILLLVMARLGIISSKPDIELFNKWQMTNSFM